MKIITSRTAIIHCLMGFALFSYSEIWSPGEMKEHFVPFNPFDGQTNLLVACVWVRLSEACRTFGMNARPKRPLKRMEMIALFMVALIILLPVIFIVRIPSVFVINAYGQ